MIKVIQIGKPSIRPYGFYVKRRSLAHGVKSGSQEILQIIEWLILNIGTVESNKWELKGYSPNYTILYFSNKNDAMAFKLRWL